MRTEIVTVDPSTIKLLDVNARFMRYETFQQLVANVRRDGRLTSVPFCWTLPDGTLEVLSGNHRVQAAVDAEIGPIDVMVTADPLTDSQRIAIQLSHNSLAGEDDPATLRQLYDSLSDVDLREYAGLDDKTLDLLAKVDVGSLNEANLDFASIQIVFLPPEVETARTALEDARKLSAADEQWLATIADHSRLLDALEQTQAAYGIGNIATALHLVLDVFDRHRTTLQDGWWDGQSDDPRHKGWVPVSSIFGRDTIPAAAAVVVAKAVEAIAGREELPDKARWQALEYLAADYLAGAGPATAHLALPRDEPSVDLSPEFAAGVPEAEAVSIKRARSKKA